MVTTALLFTCVLETGSAALGLQEPAAPQREQALRFLERSITTTHDLLAGNARTYVVLERTAAPGIDLGAVSEIHQHLAELQCGEDVVNELRRRLDIQIRPPSISTTTIHVSSLPNGGSALLFRGDVGLAMWAEWSVPENHRWDFFPVAARQPSDIVTDRLQVNAFDEDSRYDPLAVRLGLLRELLEWGMAGVAGGAGEYTRDPAMETLRVRWTKTASDPFPVRIGLHLAFTAIGQDIEWTLQRSIPPAGELPVSHLQVLQRDRSGQLLQCKEFQWHETWPSSFAASETEFFPGGRHLYKSENVTIMAEPEAHFSAVYATLPSLNGAHVMDWRIDGELGEYAYQDRLVSLQELRKIAAQSKR